jgi:2-methylcitrate dehydratase PrpD
VRAASYEPREALPIGDLSQFARFLCHFDLQDVPGDAVSKAKVCLLDALGCMIAGAQTRTGRIARDYAGRGVQEGEASLTGCSRRVLVQNAAFGNGVMASALDADDGHRQATGHPGAVIIPAALAVAESTGASGSRLVESLVCGYETAIRIGAALFSSSGVLRGSGHWGSVGAAAACGKILGLDEAKMTAALGIASSSAPAAPPKILREGENWPMTKECVGWGSNAGVSASLLAQQGFSGPTLLRGIQEDACDDLGVVFRIRDVYFKPYPSCRWTHPAVDAALELKRRWDIAGEDVAAVCVSTFARAGLLSYIRPRTVESAQFSIPFTIGAALALGSVSVHELTESQLDNPAILHVAERVRIEHRAEFDALFPEAIPAEVTVTLRDGARFAARVDVPKGSPGNPMDLEAILAKFRELATYGKVSSEQQGRIVRAVLQAESAEDLSDITGPLRGE